MCVLELLRSWSLDHRQFHSKYGTSGFWGLLLLACQLKLNVIVILTSSRYWNFACSAFRPFRSGLWLVNGITCLFVKVDWNAVFLLGSLVSKQLNFENLTTNMVLIKPVGWKRANYCSVSPSAPLVILNVLLHEYSCFLFHFQPLESYWT